MLNGGRANMTPFLYAITGEGFHLWPFFTRPKS